MFILSCLDIFVLFASYTDHLLNFDYNVVKRRRKKDISAAICIIKLVPNEGFDTGLLLHGQIYILSYLHNLRIQEC